MKKYLILLLFLFFACTENTTETQNQNTASITLDNQSGKIIYGEYAISSGTPTPSYDIKLNVNEKKTYYLELP